MAKNFEAMNLQDVEIKTKSVEKQLLPLVVQVTTLVNQDAPRKRRRGKSKKPAVLVAAVERATQNFIEKGEQVALENPEFSQEMLSAVEDIRTTGLRMSVASSDFADDPLSSKKRADMVTAARRLLAAVLRLLILADMVDVRFLLQSIAALQGDLEKLKNVSGGDELAEYMKNFRQHANILENQTLTRQQNMIDPQTRDDLAAARAVLKKCSTMLLQASKIYVQNPELSAARDNRDRVLKQLCEAVDVISDIAQGRIPEYGSRTYDGPGKLASELDQFDDKFTGNSFQYNRVETKVTLEKQLEDIVSSSILMTESESIKDERKQRIVEVCDETRKALQSLLSEYTKNLNEGSAGFKSAQANLSRKTKDLRRQLQKAAVDRIFDSFLEASTPLLALVSAAEQGNKEEVERCAIIFLEHSNQLAEVARDVSNLSNNPEGAKMVRYAIAQLEALSPEVVNAAQILVTQPTNTAAQENMNMFRQAWEAQVQILTEAVDEITTIDDVLSVFENQILQDINECVEALKEGDPELLNTLAQNIRGRLNRITAIAESEMDNYEPCTYTKHVLQAIKILKDQFLPGFNKQIEIALSNKPLNEIDENEFIDTTRLVYDGVREIRRAVLMNRADEDLDPEEIEVEQYYLGESETAAEEYSDMSGITYARTAMNQMPEEEKRKILEQVENFESEKLTFDREVDKWDDAGNDIIALAKNMCLIMMQMTDFVRQRGPLKTTTDVINAAKRISEAGTKLDKLTKQIGEQCPESSTKQDLFAYLERVALYCHQINIISKVKADVQNTDEALIVAGVESATSLIENAKNLMNAVVLTVKASYVASTKYSRHVTFPSQIVWKMKAPEKKPLVRREKTNEVRTVIRRASQRKVTPIQALSEFQNAPDLV